MRLTSAHLDDLDARISGRLLQAGDEGWDEAVQIWNGMAATEPALVVRPATAADVGRAVRFAATNGLVLSIKGGGHNIAGTSIARGGLTLDMSLLREVSMDQSARLVHAGAGCLLKDVDAVTQAEWDKLPK